MGVMRDPPRLRVAVGSRGDVKTEKKWKNHSLKLTRRVVLNLFELAARYFDIKIVGALKSKKRDQNDENMPVFPF